MYISPDLINHPLENKNISFHNTRFQNLLQIIKIIGVSDFKLILIHHLYKFYLFVFQIN